MKNLYASKMKNCLWSAAYLDDTNYGVIHTVRVRLYARMCDSLYDVLSNRLKALPRTVRK